MSIDTALDAPIWHERAACADDSVDPNLFLPKKGDNGNAAKAICATCPVRAECIETALAQQERHGIWGGLSVKRIREGAGRPRKVRPIAHGTPGGYRTHRRRGEDACPACLEAQALYKREYRAAKGVLA